MVAYRVEEREQRSRGGHGWRSVDSGVSDAIFGVRDATGTCIVDPDGANRPHREAQNLDQ